MKAIFKMEFDAGRAGSLSGIFVAETTDVDQLISSGKEIYFGEVLGKHSQVFGPIEESDMTLVTDSPTVVAMFEQYDMETGYNPFDYIDDED